MRISHGFSALAKRGIAGLLLCAASGLAMGQAYPNKPIKIIMPWLDGFPANSVRLYANGLEKRYKQPVVVEVKPGAGGEVAARQVINSPNDGYTLLGTGSSVAIRSVVDAKNVDPSKDLQPIAQLTTTPYVIVSKAGKYQNIGNFLAAAKASPGKINFASAGVGTGMHYLGELINTNAKIQIVHVPYQTGSRQLLAVMADEVDIGIISLITAWPQIKAGKLEALAVSSTTRSKALPEVPTLAESGVKGIPSIGAWIALFGPKNLDPAILKSLSENIQAIANDPASLDTVAQWGGEIPDASIGGLENVLESEKKSWTQLAKEKNLMADK